VATQWYELPPKVWFKGHVIPVYRERDSQRKKLYDAERRALWNNSMVILKKFDSVRLIQRYVDKLLKEVWFTKRFGKGWQIDVNDGRGRRAACGWGNTNSKCGYIKMPVWSRDESVVLHEVAHCLTTSRMAGHGRQYARIFLELVCHKMGSFEGKALKQAFKDGNVKFSPFKVRPDLKGKSTAGMEKIRQMRLTKAAACGKL